MLKQTSRKPLPTSIIGRRHRLCLLLSIALILALASTFPSPSSAATFVVDDTQHLIDASPGDGVCLTGVGSCTLRAAIQEANALAGADTIHFSIAGIGPHSISPTGALPAISTIITIDGYSQPGAVANTNSVAVGGTNATLMIELDGTVAGAIDGFRIATGGMLTVRGLVINRFSRSGIRTFSGALGFAVEGNFIGTDSTGSADLGNAGFGLRIDSTTGTLGGTAPAARNLISGNESAGIRLRGAAATGILVQGNLIGTNASGTSALGNTAQGILVQGSADSNTIGGTTSGARNVVSGNGNAGVQIQGVTNTAVEGNFIGTDVFGTASVGNAQQGIKIANAIGNRVGGTLPAARNLISGNNTSGLDILGAAATGNLVQGNYIGTDVTGISPLGNSSGVRIWLGASSNTLGGTAVGAGNLISGNSGAGVRIFNTGTTGNDVQGNLIGPDAGGTGALGNMDSGVIIRDEATSNTIGGLSAGARNVISGNGDSGILIENTSTSGNSILGNLIGTDVFGMADLGNTTTGVRIADGASGNTVGGAAVGSRNIISGNDTDGLVVENAATDTNVIEGNYIGTDITGTLALANGSAGVRIRNNNTSNRIGGSAAGAGNVISGNLRVGIVIAGAADTIIEGNLVGTGQAGATALGNAVRGIDIIRGATGTRIGGTIAGAGNVVSGNFGYGISIREPSTTGTTVQGNLIGTDISGTLAIGNAQLPGTSGVEVGNSVANTIGGNTSAARNIISGNLGDGVQLINGANANLVLGNFIGTEITGSAALPNARNGVLINQNAGGALDVSNNRIGGLAAGEGNVIAAHSLAGIAINGAGSGNIVQGNSIGTDAAGTVALPNGVGIDILNGQAPLVQQNTVLNNATGVRLTAGGSFTAGSIDNCLVFNGSGLNNLTGVNAVFTNSWWGSPDGPSGSGSGNGDSVSSDVTFSPFLAAAPLGCPAFSADLAATKSDGVTTATPGLTVTYSIVVSNAGPNDVLTASVADTFPAALACTWTSVAAGGATGNTNGSGDLGDAVGLPAGSLITYTVVCAIDPGATGILSNTATVTSPVDDGTLGNNTDTDDDTLLVPEADLSILKTGDPDQVNLGETITYMLDVNNLGPSTASSIEVVDTLPAGVVFVDAFGTGWTCVEAGGIVTCTLPTLAPGPAATLTVIVQAPQDTGTLVNDAVVSSATNDPNSADNTSSATTLVGFEIPTLGGVGIVLFTSLLALLGLALIRRV